MALTQPDSQQKINLSAPNRKWKAAEKSLNSSALCNPGPAVFAVRGGWSYFFISWTHIPLSCNVGCYRQTCCFVFLSATNSTERRQNCQNMACLRWKNSEIPNFAKTTHLGQAWVLRNENNPLFQLRMAEDTGTQQSRSSSSICISNPWAPEHKSNSSVKATPWQNQPQLLSVIWMRSIFKICSLTQPGNHNSVIQAGIIPKM